LQLAASPALTGAHPARQADFKVPRRLMSSMMSFMPVVWIVWAAIITFLLVLLVYRSNLTRYEEDQIFLDESANHQKQEQEQILVKVKKIQPLIRIVTGATCLLTVGIIGLYVWDAVQHLM
jgi:Tfp pilus assembly protein PilN